MVGADGEQPVFYYDLGSPACYLAAERIMAEFPVVPEWVPVLAHDLGETDYEAERQLLERVAPQVGLQPLRWPRALDSDPREAMLAATYAQHIGRGVSFSIACFRQVFAAGRDIGDRNTMLIAAAACEMHPTAVLRGIGLRSVTEGLHRAARRARADNVERLPAVIVPPAGERPPRHYEGATAVELAAHDFEAPAAP